MNSRGWWLVGVIFVPVACSLANAPDDPFAPEGDGGAGAVGGSGGAPECIDDAECAALSDECNDGVCTNGSCETTPKADGEPCGDSTGTECNAPDTCLAGVCAPNLVSNGTPCQECPAGPGQCGGCLDGACPDCTAFATEKTFVRESAVAGWELTGGWGLYQAAPRNHGNEEEIDFPGVVLGTDGNRAKPYPGSETETSYVRTTPTTLPAALSFSSWHVDEGGGGIDVKVIRISTDGGTTWTPVADCSGSPPLNAFPFCQFFNAERAPTAWDAITIAVPTDMIGQKGIVEFSYDTGDSCCDFERGWYLTNFNFATDCACQDEASCSWASGDCGTGTCHASGECRLTPILEVTACGDQNVASTCDNPNTCDDAGYCRQRGEPDGTACYDCMGGVDDCNTCQAGVCLSCMNLEPTNTFASGSNIAGWERTGGWNRYTNAPVSQQFTSVVTFGDGVFGTDGNRVAPYPGNEVETSSARTTPFVVPNQITFQSWHVDEGGGADMKKISLSMDGGATWVPIVDCATAGLNNYPFCLNYITDRPASVWDAIVIDTSAHAGQVAIMEFAYSTGDSCCNFERGWYIDELNVTRRCLD